MNESNILNKGIYRFSCMEDLIHVRKLSQCKYETEEDVEYWLESVIALASLDNIYIYIGDDGMFKGWDRKATIERNNSKSILFVRNKYRVELL